MSEKLAVKALVIYEGLEGEHTTISGLILALANGEYELKVAQLIYGGEKEAPIVLEVKKKSRMGMVDYNAGDPLMKAR